MTLKELKARIDWLVENDRRWETIELGIRNHKGGMGGTSITKIKSVGKGIDWDRGIFFINPEVDMIEKPEKDSK